MAPAKNLVIVESPAKKRTINKFLGPDYRVEASLGHVKDLPKSKLGVDPDKGFEPTYRVIPKKKKVLSELRSLAKDMEEIWLATDPDREGEAIGFHLAEELGNGRKVLRVHLTEITKRGVEEAFSHPTEIDHDKVNAQQARRILDRLVGYKLSPLLWDKVRRGLSAGRVQSVALRMIVERQKEIDAFVKEEYWTIDAKLAADQPPEFTARLIKEKDEESKIGDEKEANRVLKGLEGATWKVASVKQKKRRRNPPPPYITSKLQQDASRSLRFSVKKTMMLAQRLYEGKDLGQAGTVGLITYMRTDSTRVSDQALGEVRSYIESTFGDKFLPKKPRTHKKKSKGAQEAHEAIRPTTLEFPPEKVASYLEKDELRLYTMIWNRFVASQMEAARFLDTRLDITVGDFTFRATGTVRKFLGFLAAHEGKNSAPPDTTDHLPSVEEGEELDLKELIPEQRFTQPPPHFNEASLVKALEENGIGRPSTYAAILDKIQAKEYVEKIKRKFHPTELGVVVSDLLTQSFGDLINVNYTARLEENLDRIEQGKLDWVQALEKFHKKFAKDLDKAREEMENLKGKEEKTDEVCEKCGEPMVIKWGRYGKFLACSGYPDCKNTRDVGEPAPKDSDIDEKCPKCGKPMSLRTGRYGPFLACEDYPKPCKTTKKVTLDDEGNIKKVEEKVLDEDCPKCGNKMMQKIGRYGPFVACSNYPDCRYIKRETTGVSCPREGCEGELVQKRGRRRAFYGCDQYPDCDFVVWNKPIPEACPECEAEFLVLKTTKKKGPHLICHVDECDHERILDDEEAEKLASKGKPKSRDS